MDNMTDKEFVLSRYPIAVVIWKWPINKHCHIGYRGTHHIIYLSRESNTEETAWSKAAKQIRKNEKEQAAKDKANQK